jgi:hypothetical protein
MICRTQNFEMFRLSGPVLLLVMTTLSVFASAVSPTSCNDLENLCSVKVTDAYFAMVHNAMAAVENGFVVAANHEQNPLVEALDAGYRGLNFDICNCDGSLQFCHGSEMVGCGVGRVDPLQAFTEINEWISTNPNNVIMISLEINEEADGPISLEMIQGLLQQVPDGFSDRLYDHWPVGSEWPMVGELIEANKQVLFFYFQGPDGTGEHIPGLNYWYDSVVATDWQWESVSEIEATLLSDCPMTRGLSSTRDFFAIEAFVTETFLGFQFQPSVAAAQVINTIEWAGAVLDACFETHGFAATIFSVDFWSEGNLPNLITQRNSLLLGEYSNALASAAHESLEPTFALTPNPSLGHTDFFPQATSPPRRTSTPAYRPSFSPSSSPLPSSQTSCTQNTTDGGQVVISDGEVFGDNATTHCEGPEEFHCLCIKGVIECPYCAFTTRNGRMYCARRNKTVAFYDGPDYMSCRCEIASDPRESPITTCHELPVPLYNGGDDAYNETHQSSATTRLVWKLVVGAVVSMLRIWP